MLDDLPPDAPLGAIPGTAGDVALALASGGAPPEIVFLYANVAISGISHGVADTQWPNGQRMTIGVSGKLLAGSTFGKSMLERYFFDFALHYGAEKYPAELPTLFMSDVDRKTLFEALHDLPIATLLVDESDQLKDLIRHPGSLAKALSGETIRFARASTGRFEIPTPALVMLSSEQPDIFELHRDQWIGGVGLGTRFQWGFSNGPAPGVSMHDIRVPSELSERFHQKVAACIDHTWAALRAGERPVIPLTEKASKYLVALSRKPLDASKPALLEYARRHTERVLRLAAAYIAFEEGPQGQILCEMIERAEACDEYSMWSFAQIVNVPPKLTQTEIDAQILERALIVAYRNTSFPRLLQSEVRTYAINFGLSGGRFAKALAHLAVSDVLTVTTRRKAIWVEMNLRNPRLRFD